MKSLLLTSLLTLGLTITLMPKLAAMESMETPEKTAQPHFQSIEQPWELKTLITLGGLTLIGLELWWFLGSKPKD